MIWYSYLFKNLLQFVVTQRVKGFNVVDKTEVDVFLGFPCFLSDPTNVDNLISASSAFSQHCLYICKFSIHVLLKPSLKDFEHKLMSMQNECNFMVAEHSLVLPFFGI